MGDQRLNSMMAGMSIDVHTPTPPSRSRPPSNINMAPLQLGNGQGAGSSTNTAGGNRLPAVMKRYMNPALVRPANTGLQARQQQQSASGPGTSGPASSSSYAESQRGPLLKLAGVNVPSPQRNGYKPTSQSPGSARKSKLSITQHTAHGLHGPAHSTKNRALSSSINPIQPTHPTAQVGNTSQISKKVEKSEIGKYDGGLEADAVGKEVENSDAAKVLDMDSSSATK